MANILDHVGRVLKRKPTKALKGISEAINQSIDLAVVDLDDLKKEYTIASATGEWLDEWGSRFNVYRELNESDVSYRARIPAIVATPRNTIPAIKQAVASYLSTYYDTVVTPSQVSIYEPYTNVIKYSNINSAWSGDDKYPDGLFWRSNVISIIIPYGATAGLKQVLHTIRPAGLRIRFDIQLVPDREDPNSTLPEPVLANTMIPTEYIQLGFNSLVIGTDGFFHPFMDGQIRYSGKKNLYSMPVITLAPAKPLPMLSPVNVFGSRRDLEMVIQVPFGGVIPRESIVIDSPKYVPPSDITPIYETSTSIQLNYNDDEFNFRISSAYTIAEIGDLPLSQACWQNGGAQIDITTI